MFLNKVINISLTKENNWTCKKLLGGGYLFRGFEPMPNGIECNGIINKRVLFKFDGDEGNHFYS